MFMVKETKTEHQFGDKPFLGFEHVTMVPMCRKLIDTSIMTPTELAWLNAYHTAVLEKTKGFFANDALTLKWLERETAPF